MDETDGSHEDEDEDLAMILIIVICIGVLMLFILGCAFCMQSFSRGEKLVKRGGHSMPGIVPRTVFSPKIEQE